MDEYKGKKFFTYPEAAEKMKRSLRSLSRYVKDGKLKTTMIGGQPRIPEESIDAFYNVGTESVDHGTGDGRGPE